MKKPLQSCVIAFLLFSAAWSAVKGNPTPSLAASQSRMRELPRVVTASVPFYPELARQTRIEGNVTLQVFTDGRLVSAIKNRSGHPILSAAATENVKSWEFRPHTATTFELTFHYTLFAPECDSDCNCSRGKRGEKESVLLHLPTEVEIVAPTLLTCDPAVEIRHQPKASKSPN